MKVIARLFLFLFIAFLSTPAILTAIDKSANTSMFFNVSEEEHVKKQVVNFTYVNLFQSMAAERIIAKTTKIHFASLKKYDKISRIIFSPPPNLV
ncbi:hypothetical protein H8R22_11475 [Flavobacterium sp. F-47]|jgi:hypothetical protein|nr:hypothetical protein [Flavobacterium kayseriense]